MSAERNEERRRISVPLLLAGVAAIAVAIWGAVGGPAVASGGTVLAVVGIVAVAIAGVTLIAKPGEKSRQAAATESNEPPD